MSVLDVKPPFRMIIMICGKPSKVKRVMFKYALKEEWNCLVIYWERMHTIVSYITTVGCFQTWGGLIINFSA